MARTFEIPQSPKTYRSSLVDFLGVDYNNPLDVDIRHSPNMINMMNRSGYLKKRNGVKIKKHIDDAPIYGIWQYDVPSDSVFKEIFVIHCGSKLYEVSTDFETVALVMSGLAENDSYGMFLGDKLVILDGKKAIVYGKYNGVYGPKYMDNVAYVPTTNIGLSPQGFNGTSFEDVNLMTQFRINEFLADGVSNEYYTDSPTISPNADDTDIWILSNENGLWEKLDKELYTVYSDNKIVFDTVPEAPLVSGRDNVRIKFKSTTDNSSELINKCRFCVPFGYQGNNQRLFFSGNPDQPNADWHSNLVEAQPDPTYIPDTSFAIIGSQPISGYLRLSDGTLAILKKLSDTDCSIYYRTSNAQGKWDIFPLQSGTKNVGCLSIYTCSNVGNFPIFLSEQGVYQAITGEASSSLERYADNKSYYIDTKLLTEENLDKAKAISLGQYYWLFINGNVYVADTLKWTETKINSILQFQWYPLEGIECRSIMKWNNQLVIGDDYGNIKMFGDDYTDDNLVEKIITTTTKKIVNTYVDAGNIVAKSQLHFHSNKSDGIQPYMETYQAYKDAGYHFLNRTDHNTAEGSSVLSGIISLRGVEQSTDEGAHVGVIDLANSNDVWNLQSGYTGAKPMEDIVYYYKNTLGKVVIANHPTKAGDEFTVAQIRDYGFHAIEIYNGKYDENYEEFWDTLLMQDIKVWGISVDDCHNVTNSMQFNRGWINVFTNNLNKGEIIQAIRDGKFVACRGHDLSIGTVTTDSISVSSSLSSNFQLIADGTVINTISNSLTANFTDINVSQYKYLRIKSISTADNNNYALSQPFFIVENQEQTSILENEEIPVYSYFETIPLDFTNPTEAKTTRNFTLNYIAPEDTKFEFGYKTIDEESVTSEEIFKRISGTLPIDYDENPQLPYGTKLNFNKSLIPETNSDEGFLGFYYGTQTEELKTIFGLYKTPDSNLTIGIYTVEVLDSSGELSITPIKLFFDNNSYILNDFLLKKLLHGSINQVNNELNIPQLDLSDSDWDFSYIYLSDPILNDIPQTIMLKEKARKIMFLKFFVHSTELACEFDRIYIQYRNAGKYRGE